MLFSWHYYKLSIVLLLRNKFQDSHCYSPSWYCGPNSEDQINRKPDDQKNDQTNKKVKKHKME